MSKIRIYELAKELGVDNKVVITKATELGMQGKSSHSNSLDADEADQLRRAIIRQAIGNTPKTEVVTRRIDRSTGAAEAIVESRSGNVIRRRRQSPGEGAPVEAEANPAAASVAAAAEPSEEALEREALFKERPSEEPQPEIEVAPEVEVTTDAEPAPVEPEPEILQATAAVESPAPEAPKARVAPTAPSAPQGEEKKNVGPRVLGKIELPQKKVVVRPEARKGAPTAAVGGAALVLVDEEEGEDAAKRKEGAKRKGRKREFSRTDLLDYEGRDVRRTSRGKSHREEIAEKKQSEVRPMAASKRVIKMSETITVGELARQMSLKAGEIIAKLIELGVMATINQAIDQDTAAIVASEFDYQIESTSFDEDVILIEAGADEEAKASSRPPVVTVMGHVDHGKTSLLDAIRHSSVAAKEHGGITQHIGASKVILPDNRSITFLDTPGHAAFTSMRARGAQVTDIVVLVVAADDGVMPQTIEAINHAKSAKVPIVVVVNKIDKHEANPEKIKQQLVEHGLQPEDWGGDTMYFPVSALKGTGVKELLEGLLLTAEVRELKANPDRRAKGTIVEARQDRGRGPVATVLVQHGTLRVGDIFVCGAESGRIRAMLDYNGERVDEAKPSDPVEITGLSGVPLAGDDFLVVDDESKAREVASNRAEKKLVREQRALATGPISLEEFARRANNLAAEELNVILKTDVHGSLEAVRDALEKLSTEKVKVRVLHSAVGGINESDIQLAIASKAVVVGFGVRAEPRALQDAETAGVDVRFYRIIYELIDDVKKAMAGLLAPIRQEVPLGRVEVRETFVIPKSGTIAGSFVVSGVVKRGANVRLLRDSRVIHEGRMSSLRRFKDDVREVQSGYECGIGIENYNDVKAGDVIEAYEFKEIAATLE